MFTCADALYRFADVALLSLMCDVAVVADAVYANAAGNVSEKDVAVGWVLVLCMQMLQYMKCICRGCCCRVGAGAVYADAA